MIELSYEEAGEIRLREPTWADFSAWWDAMAADRRGDGINNLVIACAVEPGPEGMAALCEDFGFLPAELAGELLGHVGAPPEGLGGSYPMMRLKAARALAPEALDYIAPETLDAIERASRRALLFRTPAGLVALRPPGRAAASAFTDAMTDVAAQKEGASPAEAFRALVLACAIVPDAAALASLIDRCPCLVYSTQEALREAATGGKAKARP